MSDNIPFEIQAKIMKRLPVRSLIQLRTVSNAWKSLIDSSRFIKDYNGHMQHLLVSYEDPLNFQGKYISIVDDNTSPQQKVSLTVPLLVKYPIIIGSSHGLLCLYGDHRLGRGGHFSGTGRAVVWNPSIRKAVPVVVPNMGDRIYEAVLGFGVCPETADPKIVKITQVNRCRDVKSVSCIPRQVEVFTLSTGVWRSLYNNNLPRKSVRFKYYKVVIAGVLYWHASDITTDGGFRSYNLIISFDMSSEEFREINLPRNLADQSYHNLSIYKLRKSLVVIECDRDFQFPDICVWMMEDDAPKSFIKLFTINIPYEPRVFVKGFRKTGEAIIEFIRVHHGVIGSLAVYEPYSKSITDLGIHVRDVSYSMYPYIETLLLLDQPVFTI